MRMPSRRRFAPSTSGIPIRRPSTAWMTIGSLWQDRQRRRADFHLAWPTQAYREDRTILIAGCGTSQAAKHALRWPEARVTGIDFSATSVRHTEALKRKYDLDNLEVHQLPVERIGALGCDLRSDRLHRRSPPPRGPGRRAGGAARGAAAGRRDAPHGLRAARTDRRLHAAGVLPAGRHRRHRRRDPGARRRARRAAARAPAGDAAAPGAGLPGRGGAGRCAAAPAGPRLFGAAALRSARGGRAAVRPLGLAGALRRALRRHGAHPASRAARGASGARTVRRRRALSRHDASPQRGRVPRRRRRARRDAGQLRRRRLARLRADSNAGHDLRRGETAAGRGRRSDQPEPRVHRHLPADRRAGEAPLRRHRRHARDR